MGEFLGFRIAKYDDVVIPPVAPVISDPNIKNIYINYWTQDSIPSDFLVNSKQTASLTFASYISATYKLEVVLVKDGEVKASAYFEGYFEDSHATYTALDVDNIVLPSEPGEYDVQIRTYRGGQLTGIYPEGKLTVYPIAEPSYLSYQNLIYQILNYPGLTMYYLDVECDIVNTGSKTITREVALWLHKWSGYPGPRWYDRRWRVIVRDSHEPGGINAGRVAFTLAPGETRKYHFAGQTIGHGECCVELRDNMGGISEYKCITW